MKIWPWAEAVMWVGVVLFVGLVKMKGISKAHGQNNEVKLLQSNRRQNNLYKHSEENLSRDHNVFKAKPFKRKHEFESRSDFAHKVIARSFNTGGELRRQFPVNLRQAKKNDINQQQKNISDQPDASKLPTSRNSNVSEDTEDGLIKRSRNRVRLKSRTRKMEPSQDGVSAKSNVSKGSRGHKFVPNETRRQQIFKGITNVDRPIEFFNGNTQRISDDGTRLAETPDSFFADPREANPGIRVLKPSHFYAPAVHKYMAAEHRYTSPPIHKYLSSPVVFRGVNGENNPTVGGKEDVMGNELSGTERQFGAVPQPFFQEPLQHRPHVIIVNRPFHSPVPVPVSGPPRIVLVHRPVPLPPQRVPVPVMLHEPRPPPLFIVHHRELSGPGENEWLRYLSRCSCLPKTRHSMAH